jgi:hypothetical protein
VLIRPEIKGRDEEEGRPLWGHKVVPRIDHPCSVSETATLYPPYFPTFPFRGADILFTVILILIAML